MVDILLEPGITSTELVSLLDGFIIPAIGANPTLSPHVITTLLENMSHAETANQLHLAKNHAHQDTVNHTVKINGLPHQSTQSLPM